MPKLPTSRLVKPAHTRIGSFDEARIAASNRCDHLNRTVPPGTPCRVAGAAHASVCRTSSNFFLHSAIRVHVNIEGMDTPVDETDCLFLN